MKKLQPETRAGRLIYLCPTATPLQVSCTKYTIYLLCYVHVTLSKYTFIQPGNPRFVQATLFSSPLSIPLRKCLNWVGTPVELGIWKDIFKAKSALNNHDKEKKSFIINYSNGHSFLKHFKDVCIETRCLLHRQPPISVDLTALLLTSVFSVGSLFHSQVERMFLLFAFLPHQCRQPLEGTPAGRAVTWPATLSFHS